MSLCMHVRASEHVVANSALYVVTVNGWDAPRYKFWSETENPGCAWSKTENAF